MSLTMLAALELAFTPAAVPAPPILAEVVNTPVANFTLTLAGVPLA